LAPGSSGRARMGTAAPWGGTATARTSCRPRVPDPSWGVRSRRRQEVRRGTGNRGSSGSAGGSGSVGGSGGGDLELAPELRDGRVLAEHLELGPHVGACESVPGGLDVDRDVPGAAALAPRCAVEVLVARVGQLVVRARGVVDLGAAVVEHEVPLADDAAVGVAGLHLDLEIDHLAVGVVAGHVVLGGVVAHRGDDGDDVPGLLVGELGADLDDGALAAARLVGLGGGLLGVVGGVLLGTVLAGA